MVSVLVSSMVDRGFVNNWCSCSAICCAWVYSIKLIIEVEVPIGSNQSHEIGICCFSAKHAAWRRKNKDWLPRNQDKVSELGDMSIRGLLFQWASTIKLQLCVLF